MKKVLLLSLLLSSIIACATEKKLTDYPQLNQSAWSALDVFPMVQLSSNANKKTTVGQFDQRYFLSGGTLNVSQLSGGTVNYVLTSNGTLSAPTWQAANALPDQSAHAGQLLTTNGSVSSWGTVATSLTVNNLYSQIASSVQVENIIGSISGPTLLPPDNDFSVRFTPSSAYSLTQAQFKIDGVSAGAVLTVTLRSDNGNPDTILATATPITVSSTGVQTLTFVFPSPYSVTSGVNYWLTMNSDFGSIITTYRNGTSYPSQEFFNNSSWQSLSNSMAFTVTGVGPVGEIGTSVSPFVKLYAGPLSVSGGVISAGSSKITNLATPTLSTDAATKAYVDSASGGANTALSNLASVAINADLKPGIDGNNNIGSSSFNWVSVWAQVLRYGSASINFGNGQMADPSGNQTLNFNSRILQEDSLHPMVGWGTIGVVNFYTNALVNVADPTNAQDAATKNYVDTHGGGGGGANTALSNLDGTTAVNSVLTFAGTNAIDTPSLFIGHYVSQEYGSDAPAVLAKPGVVDVMQLGGQDATAGHDNPTDVYVFSGANTVSGSTKNTGDVAILSGASDGNSSSAHTGNVLLESGNKSVAGKSGNIYIQTGDGPDNLWANLGGQIFINTQASGLEQPLLEIHTGGVRIRTDNSEPTCDSVMRYVMRINQGGTGVADVPETCLKLADDSFAWQPSGGGGGGGAPANSFFGTYTAGDYGSPGPAFVADPATSDVIYFGVQDATAGHTSPTDVYILSGRNTGLSSTSNTGDIAMITGASDGNSGSTHTGNIDIATGEKTTAGNSGNVFIQTGNSPGTGVAGNIYLRPGSNGTDHGYIEAAGVGLQLINNDSPEPTCTGGTGQTGLMRVNRGTPDVLEICLQNGDSTYSWVQLATGTP